MIGFQAVNKRYGEQVVLRDASFSIHTGERVGIVGPNGAGKSTIFSLIGGDISPDSGAVETPRGLKLGYLRQYLGAGQNAATLIEHAESGVPLLLEIQRELAELTATIAAAPSAPAVRLERLGELQSAFEHLGGYSVRHRAEAALGGLGFAVPDLDRPLVSFSGGWRMRAELARVTTAEPDVLMLDEPSNYLDTVAIEWLQRFLRDYQGTLLLISHDRYLLNTLCTVILEVHGGRVTRYRGDYAAYVEARARRMEQLRGEQAKQERIVKQAEQFIERFRAKNTKASQVQSRIKMLDRMERVETMHPDRKRAGIRIPEPPSCGHTVVSLAGVGHTYDGTRWIVRGIDVTIERGAKIGLVGLNGTGKTTLLRIIAGRMKPTEGHRRLGHRAAVGYQSQEFTETLDEQATAYETVRRIPAEASDQDVRTLLGGFGFSGAAAEKRVAVLSGGERVRLAFARMLIAPPPLLVLDEPTTHLDIGAREALEAALDAYSGTLCFVSHDIAFVRRVAATIVAMAPPRIHWIPGGYDYYRDLLAAGRLASIPLAKPGAAAPAQPAVRAKQARRERAETVQKYAKARRDLQRHMERMEKRITACEAEQAALAAQFEQQDTVIDYDATARSIAAVQQKLADTTRRWEAYAIELDELETTRSQGAS